MNDFYRWLASKVGPYLDTTVHNRLTHLEARMAKSEDALAELDVATDEIATELEDLRDDVAQHDAALAAKITEKAARLRGLAKDPENPVPPVTDEPVVEEPPAPAEPTA